MNMLVRCTAEAERNVKAVYLLDLMAYGNFKVNFLIYTLTVEKNGEILLQGFPL